MNTYTAVTVPTQLVETTGIRFAYRRWGKRSGLPLVFNHHLNGNLDNWDHHEDFVFEANRFLAGYGATAETSVRAQSTTQVRIRNWAGKF